MKSTEAIPLVTPDPDPVTMVRVTAPSNMEGGYTFDAVYNGEVFPVTVPAGGVRSGQSFEVPFAPEDAFAIATVVEIPEQQDEQQTAAGEATPMLTTARSADDCAESGGCNRNNNNHHRNQRTVPLGEFESGLCDCLSEGFLHPSFLNAVCCPQILMAQVLTRMKLGFCGFTVSGNAYKNTTAAWMVATLVLWYLRSKYRYCDDLDTSSASSSPHVETLKVLVDGSGHEKVLNREIIDDKIPFDTSRCTKSMRSSLQFVNWIWFWTTTLVLARLRRVVRDTNGIAGYTPFKFLEDLFCAYYCGCCTVSQLARETANYATERAYYLSSTGMADEWTDRFETFERRHREGHHLVHAHHPAAAGSDRPHTHGGGGERYRTTTTTPTEDHVHVV